MDGNCQFLCLTNSSKSNGFNLNIFCNSKPNSSKMQKPTEVRYWQVFAMLKD